METGYGKLRDRSSAYDFVKSGEVITREHQIAAEHKKILRNELKECLASNHENANEKCYELRVAYVKLLEDRFQGMVFPAGLQPKNRLQPRIINPDKEK